MEYTYHHHLILIKSKRILMTTLTVDTLKKICDKVPGEYTVRVVTSKGDVVILKDIIEVDISSDNLILKE